jgi:hypothetical protein
LGDRRRSGKKNDRIVPDQGKIGKPPDVRTFCQAQIWELKKNSQTKQKEYVPFHSYGLLAIWIYERLYLSQFYSEMTQSVNGANALFLLEKPCILEVSFPWLEPHFSSSCTLCALSI